MNCLITDLRSYRSPPPLPDKLVSEWQLSPIPSELIEVFDAGRTYNNGAPPLTITHGGNSRPNTARERDPGSMLGAAQKQWFKSRLETSGANWKVWGNSLPILSLRLDLSTLPRDGLQDGALGQDAWAGYPTEYRELMNFLAGRGITNVVSLSGDHHCHGAGALAKDANAPRPRICSGRFQCVRH